MTAQSHPITILYAVLLLSLRPIEMPVTKYAVDVTKSKVQWTGYYLFSFGEHFGSIDISNGELETLDGVITGGFFEINMRSIRDLDMKEGDGGKDLSDHLIGKDFFDAEKHPTSKFEITKTEKIKEPDPNGPNYDVFGFLTIKGVRREQSFPAKISLEGNVLRAKAKFKFDRTKWGVEYNSGKIFSDVGDGAISDAIAIDIDLHSSSK